MKRLFKKIAKKTILAILALIAIGVPLLYLTILNSQPVSAWFDENWLYRKSIAISSHSASENNVYINLTGGSALDTSDTTRFQTDCGDLRFTKQNGEILPYYIVSGCGTATTVIHVQFDTFPSGAQTIYYYYGNPAVSNGFNPADFSTEASGYALGSAGSEEQSPGPVAYWKFDDGQGQTAQDSSVNNNDGTVSAATWVTENQCVAGKCLYFNGSTASVTVSNTVTGVKTISFWVKPKTNGETLMDLDGGTHYLSASSGIISATGFTSPTIYVNGVVSSTLTANTWQMVTVTTGTSFSASAIKVGNVTTSYLNGFIDDVKIYNFAKTAAQVKQDFEAKSGAAGKQGSSVVMGAQQQDYLSNGLVGYWKMDEASWNGTANEVVDSSGNSNHGVRAGDATTTSGKFGNAGTFDGTGDYANMGDPSSGTLDFGTGDFTLATWFYVPSLPGAWSSLINKGASGVTGYGLTITDGGSYLSADINGSGGSNQHVYSTNTAFTAGVWHHGAAVFRRSDKIYLYIDGELKLTQAFASGNTNTVSNSGNFTLGSYQNGTSFLLNGKLDETRVYNRALSPKEVSDLYNFAPGPVGYWNFEEGSGTTAYDISTNGYSGTITGATYQSGKFGKALNFNGSTDTVDTISSISGIQTVSFWVNPSSTTSNLIDVQTSPSTINISASSGTISATGFTSPTYYVNGVQTTSPTLTANSWQYITVTSATAVTGSALRFGRISTTSLTGKLDEIKVYSYARSAKQIVSDMNGGSPSTSSGRSGSPIGYWKFDEGADNRCSGGTNDVCNSGSGGSALDGAESGMAVPATSTSGWTQSGKFGKALNFDGSNDYVAMPSDVSALKITSDITLSAWINLTNTSSQHDIICKYTGTASTSAYCLYTDTNGKLNMSVVNATGPAIVTTTGTKTLSASTWYHVVGILNTTLGSVDLYVNGILDKHNTTSIPTTLQNPTTILDIGAENAGSNLFNGTIDEPKVYNYALTSDEVKTEYNRGSSLVLGALSDNSSYQKGAANQEYCVPGDTTSCTAPVGRWDFEEGNGTTANDTSGNGNTGTWNGTSSHWTSGKIGKAGNFAAGNSDSVNAGTGSSISITGAITISAWVKLSSLPSGNDTAYSIVAKDKDTGGRAYTLDIYKNQAYGNCSGAGITCFRFYINGGGTKTSSGNQVDSLTNVQPNTWYYVEATYTPSGAMHMYVNGKLDDQNSITSAPASIPTATANLRLGSREYTGFLDYLNGQLDQVKIFNYARSSAQVAWDYNRGAPVGHWKLDECQGTVANDSSGKGNNGTIAIGASGEDTVGTCTTSSTAWGSGATGKRNYSLSFDGTDDAVSLGDPSFVDFGTGNFSFSGWGKVASLPGSSMYTLVGKDQDTGRQFLILFGGANGTNMIRFSFFVGGSEEEVDTASNVITDTNWHHIAGVRNGGTSYIYVDGIQKASTSVSTGSMNATDTIFYIGRRSYPSYNNYWNGQIDDVRIYNYALTATQVKDIYNGGAINFGPSTGSP